MSSFTDWQFLGSLFVTTVFLFPLLTYFHLSDMAEDERAKVRLFRFGSWNSSVNIMSTILCLIPFIFYYGGQTPPVPPISLALTSLIAPLTISTPLNPGLEDTDKPVRFVVRWFANTGVSISVGWVATKLFAIVALLPFFPTQSEFDYFMDFCFRMRGLPEASTPLQFSLEVYLVALLLVGVKFQALLSVQRATAVTYLCVSAIALILFYNLGMSTSLTEANYEQAVAGSLGALICKCWFDYRILSLSHPYD